VVQQCRHASNCDGYIYRSKKHRNRGTNTLTQNLMGGGYEQEGDRNVL